MIQEPYGEFEGKEGTKFLTHILPGIILFIAVVSVAGFWLRSAGLIGSTVVERVVFENSYQRSAALEERIATDEAALVEINAQLQNESLDDGTKANLAAQAAAARVRISTAKAHR